MSLFTVVIIIWVIYQLITTVIKKNGTQQMPGKLSDSVKLPDGRFIRDVIQGPSRGTWREQLKQALENGPYQAKAPESKDLKEILNEYIETEGTLEIREDKKILGLSRNIKIEETPREEVPKIPQAQRGNSFSLTERELIQGVMWAEILGKPRAMGPYRGPRS